MAARLVLRGSAALPHIWNVSARVGPGFDEPNNATDVELLNALLGMALRHPSIARFGIKGESPIPSRGPNFDPVLGFWIFRFQQLERHPSGDGVASPARGTNFAPGTPWVIVSFNRLAKESDPQTWATLNLNPNITQQLRAELSR